MTSHRSPITAVHRFRGAQTTELVIHARPGNRSESPARQAASVYQAIAETLASEAGASAPVVRETVFFRDIHQDLPAAQSARARALPAMGDGNDRITPSYVGIPPAHPECALEVLVTALVPHAPGGIRIRELDGHASDGHRVESIRVGDFESLRAVNLIGQSRDAEEQLRQMFRTAGTLLRDFGMSAENLARTWIYLRNIDRDYDLLNRIRREFFAAVGVSRLPASTGVQGAPAVRESDFALSFEALRLPKSGDAIRILTTPRLNEASVYGADFARGVAFDDGDKRSIKISGTASIDEYGNTVHDGDLPRQVERMLENIGSLLAGTGAGLRDINSAVVYVKHRDHAESVEQICRATGFAGFPVAYVVTPLCRPDLLCEAEATAVLPLAEGPA